MWSKWALNYNCTEICWYLNKLLTNSGNLVQISQEASPLSTIRLKTTKHLQKTFSHVLKKEVKLPVTLVTLVTNAGTSHTQVLILGNMVKIFTLKSTILKKMIIQSRLKTVTVTSHDKYHTDNRLFWGKLRKTWWKKSCEIFCYINQYQNEICWSYW